jgi:hypothetical protein
MSSFITRVFQLLLVAKVLQLSAAQVDITTLSKASTNYEFIYSSMMLSETRVLCANLMVYILFLACVPLAIYIGFKLQRRGVVIKSDPIHNNSSKLSRSNDDYYIDVIDENNLSSLYVTHEHI